MREVVFVDPSERSDAAIFRIAIRGERIALVARMGNVWFFAVDGAELSRSIARLVDGR
jgi:hypothetical protein